MKRREERKTTLVDFMRSIKFSGTHSSHSNEYNTPFAALNQRVRGGSAATGEDYQLVRSAN
jgi:hypothetical protein